MHLKKNIYSHWVLSTYSINFNGISNYIEMVIKIKPQHNFNKYIP